MKPAAEQEPFLLQSAGCEGFDPGADGLIHAEDLRAPADCFIAREGEAAVKNGNRQI